MLFVRINMDVHAKKAAHTISCWQLIW